MGRKYIKPKSLTWWCSLCPIVLGVTIATEPLHGGSDLVQVANTITGGASPAMLINAGLAGIGLRAAL